MAQNHIQTGDVMPWINATGLDVAAGSVVEIGATVGVALGDIADGAAGSVAIEEVFELPKEAPLVIAQGVVVYWDSTAGVITLTATDNPVAGKAFAAAASAAVTVQVKLGA